MGLRGSVHSKRFQVKLQAYIKYLKSKVIFALARLLFLPAEAPEHLIHAPPATSNAERVHTHICAPCRSRHGRSGETSSTHPTPT